MNWWVKKVTLVIAVLRKSKFLPEAATIAESDGERAHAKPVVFTLHWLPIQQSIII